MSLRIQPLTAHFDAHVMIPKVGGGTRADEKEREI